MRNKEQTFSSRTDVKQIFSFAFASAREMRRFENACAEYLHARVCFFSLEDHYAW